MPDVIVIYIYYVLLKSYMSVPSFRFRYATLIAFSLWQFYFETPKLAARELAAFSMSRYFSLLDLIVWQVAPWRFSL